MAYGDAVVVVDSSRNVYVFDPTTGHGRRHATIGTESFVWPVDPVVAGDTLLVVLFDAVHALDLPSGRDLWSFSTGGLAERPPTVVGDTVLWLTGEQSSESGAPSDATVHAHGLQDGARRWQVKLPGVSRPGGIIGFGDLALVSTPPVAFDLATGAERWRADPGGTPVGGPGLDEATGTLFVGLIGGRGGGAVAALDARTGAVRFYADLGSASVNASDRIWVADGVVVVPGGAGVIIGLDAGDGRERWRFRSSSPRLGNVTVDGDRVWLVQEDARVIAIHVGTGRREALFRDVNTSLNSQGSTQRPLVMARRVVVAAGRMVLGLDVPVSAGSVP